MKIFQWLADKINGWDFPEWVHAWLNKLLKYVVIPSLEMLGEECLSFLEKKIIEASRKDISNKEKFAWVFARFTEEYSLKNLKDSTINWGIETCYSKLKQEGMIK